LLCNELGVDTASAEQLGVAKTSLSVKEAVQIAKDNNFMGLICNFELMVCLLIVSLPLKRAIDNFLAILFVGVAGNLWPCLHLRTSFFCSYTDSFRDAESCAPSR
jgi:hypothetical protein